MKIGIFSVVDHYPCETFRSVERFYQEILEQMVAADELGFHSFYLAEHHFHEYGVAPRPPLLLSAAAQRTRRLRLGSAVVVLPFDNPLRTAEDYAMVDVLSGGRLTLGVGSGYLSHEYRGFGIDPAQKRERFDEALTILLSAWSGRRFSFHGRHYSVDNVKLNVVPLQKPHPPVSVAILRDEAAVFVARKGMPILMIPYATSDSVAQLADTARIFRSEFVGSPGAARSSEIRVALHAYCHEDSAAACRTAGAAMERYVRTRLYARQREFSDLRARDLIAVGDPAEVLAVARAYRDAGATELLLITNFGALSHRKVVESMELIARHVIPTLAAEEGRSPTLDQCAPR